MDRDTFDYMYGESSAPDPTQEDLDQVLARADQVRVLSGGLFRGEPLFAEVLATCAGREEVAALRQALRIQTDPSTFNHCACFGGPTIELLEGNRRLALIGLQHGQSIRWSRWKHDARLQDGGPLDRWLKDHGVDPELLDDIYHNRYRAGMLCRVGPPALSRLEQRLRRIDSQRINGDLTGARAACDQILKEDAGQAMAYAMRAMVYHDLGETFPCLMDCTTAIEGGLALPDLFFTRAICHDALGQVRDGIEDCTSALALEPNHANAYNSRGIMLNRLGQTEAALADLGEAIRLAPRWALPYLNRGEMHQAGGDVRAALADFDQVVALAQGEQVMGMSLKALGHFKRFECHRDLGDARRAEADYQEALQIEPHLLDCLQAHARQANGPPN